MSQSSPKDLPSFDELHKPKDIVELHQWLLGLQQTSSLLSSKISFKDANTDAATFDFPSGDNLSGKRCLQNYIFPQFNHYLTRTSTTEAAEGCNKQNEALKVMLFPPKLTDEEIKTLLLSEKQKMLEQEQSSARRKAVPCGYVFRKGEPVYHCRTCGLDDTCVLCSKCFEGSEHERHDVIITYSQQGGGICDCGDEEAWVKEIDCLYHGFTTPKQKNSQV